MTERPMFPLAVGNQWTYRMKDGTTFFSQVMEEKDGLFFLSDSFTLVTSRIKKVGDEYITDRYQQNTWQVTVKDNLKKGDTWQVKFQANGVDTTLIHVVKELGLTRTVEGTTYTDVAMVEAESKMSMNGRAIPMQFFTQYYYAAGIGLILTTTSTGDAMPLIKYTVT